MFARYLVILVLIFAPVVSAADPEGLYLSEGLIVYTLSFNQSPTAVTSRTIAASQTGLGYVFGGWAYVGGVFTYIYQPETTSDSNNATTSHSETYEYYGPSVGYMGDSWSFILHYFAYTEQKDNVSAPTTSYTTDRTGTGWGLDIGYRFNLGALELGPMIAVDSINYQNCKDPNTGATSSCSPTITQFDVTPYFQLFVNFK